MEIWIDPRLTEYLKLRKKALQQREAPALFQLGQIYLRLQTSGARSRRFPASVPPQPTAMPRPSL